MIKYQQIADKLIKKVILGKYKPGDRIPSEKSIADEFDVSVQTVNKAISSLVASGYVERHKGLGAFVKDSVDLEKLKISNPLVVGIVIDSSVKNIGNANSVLGRITFSLQYILRQNNFSWVIISEKDGMSVDDYLDEIDAIVAVGDITDNFVKKVSGSKIPCVTFNRDFTSAGFSSVMISDQGIKDFVRQMVADGHKSFIFVTDDADKQVYRIRLNQFENALELYEKECNRVVFADRDFEEGKIDTKKKEILVKSDCAFLPNDSLAIKFLNLLETYDIPVPGKMSICGFDNSIAGRHCSVPLTTITYDIFEACNVITDVLERILFNREKIVRESIDSWLILRDSTAKR